MNTGYKIGSDFWRSAGISIIACAAIGSHGWTVTAWSQEPLQNSSPSPPAISSTDSEATSTTAGQATEKPSLVRLDPQHEVWVDAKRRRLIVGGQICLRQGLLEMFACPRGTKEHESIVAVNAPAYLVHTGLLAIGARSGHPVEYDPVYKAASGDTIHVDVLWRNAQGTIERHRAQQLIRRVDTREPMTHEWVFAGSGFWEDEESGKRYYQAEGGELICLSNFSTATLDLNVESPRDNADLLYEALTEKIPPLGTKVRLVLSVARVAEPESNAPDEN